MQKKRWQLSLESKCPTVHCNDGFKTKSTGYQKQSKVFHLLVLTGGKYDYGVYWVKRVKERDYKAVREHRAFITVLFSKTTNLQLTGLIVSA